VKDASPHLNVRTRWWIPSLSATIWIMLFLGLNLTSARIVLISADSDPAWHRRYGEWTIKHHTIVRENNLLHTHQGPFVSMEWLSEVVYAAAGNLFGWNGVVLVAATLIATIYWLLHRHLLAEGCDALLATILVLVAMLAGSMHWLARPLLFTHLLALVFAWQLSGFQQGRVSIRKLFLCLPLLMVLWVNLHGAFMTGLVLIAMYALGSACSAWWQSNFYTKPKTLVGLFLVCLVASFANPNGWKPHAQILAFLHSPELSTLTTEFGSPNFHTVGMQGFLLLVLILAVTLMVVRPSLNATEMLLVGGWGYLVLLSVRNVPIFALVVTPLLANWLTNYFSQTKSPSLWRQIYHVLAVRLSTLDRAAGNAAPIGSAILCMLLILGLPRITGSGQMLATDFPASRYPTDVVAHLRTYPEIVHGEMFNTFFWGGYLEYALPKQKAFFDAEFYNAELWRDFQIMDQPKPGWQDAFAKYHIGWTLLPVQHPLNRILELNPHWSLVFSNQQALVFSHVS
jgi:hypothetical protein